MVVGPIRARIDRVSADTERLVKFEEIEHTADVGLRGEEMPEAYKEVSEVIDVMDGAGISRRVAKLRPVGVIKG